MSPICCTCACEMRCSKTGRVILLVANGHPYQMWHGDEFTCPQCGARAVLGFGADAYSHDWQPDFARLLEVERADHNIIEVQV